jgi:hypothetical protein
MVLDATLIKRWPKDLVDRIAARDFILVVGAGASIGCTNDQGKTAPSWRELLLSLTQEFATSRATKTEAKRLINNLAFLDAAELLKSQAAAASKLADFFKLISEAVDGAPGHNFKPRPLHDALLALNPPIIVTTNYDSILERASDRGYRVKSYTDEDVGYDIRTGAPVLFKIHGSIDAPQKVILTRSDYSAVRRDGARSMEVLQALLLTRTSLFVGYSLSDPDIQLLLENNFGSRGDRGAHYLLCGRGMQSYQRAVMESSYGTMPIFHASGDYGEAERMIELLAQMADNVAPS